MKVKTDLVVFTHGSGNSALRVLGIRLHGIALAEDEHAAGVGEVHGGAQTGNSASEDQKVHLLYSCILHVCLNHTHRLAWPQLSLVDFIPIIPGFACFQLTAVVWVFFDDLSDEFPMRCLRVPSEQGAYEVIVGRGAWRALRQFSRVGYSRLFVLTEESLWRRWGRIFCREGGIRIDSCLFIPPGEKSKSLRMLERLSAELAERGADRRSLLIAFGGGVVGDLGGFLASTYMRGIDYLQVPTTIVAQVDSAIGGKTGVDVRASKNLIGTFYPPRLVLAEPIVLSTLQERTFRSGLYEVVKHGILAGAPLFDDIETRLDSLRPGNSEAIEPILARAARVKVDVVSRDEREAGLRRILNLGHTFGHAFEEATGYRRFLHGEAVGWGILAATRLAERLELLTDVNGERSDGKRIAGLLRRVGPLPPIRDLEPTKILELLPRDKKAIGGKIHWVLPERIGKIRIVTDVPAAAVTATLRDLQRSEWND